MTNQEFLESLNVVHFEGNGTVTIPLSMYNMLIEANTKLRIAADVYMRADPFAFRDGFGLMMGIEEEPKND